MVPKTIRKESIVLPPYSVSVPNNLKKGIQLLLIHRNQQQSQQHLVGCIKDVLSSINNAIQQKNFSHLNISKG